MTHAHKTTRPQVGKYTPAIYALVTASLLPYRERWRRLAAALPAGDVLMVMPRDAGPLRDILHALAPVLRARGRHISAVPAESLGGIVPQCADQ